MSNTINYALLKAACEEALADPGHLGELGIPTDRVQNVLIPALDLAERGTTSAFENLGLMPDAANILLGSSRYTRHPDAATTLGALQLTTTAATAARHPAGSSGVLAGSEAFMPQVKTVDFNMGAEMADITRLMGELELGNLDCPPMEAQARRLNYLSGIISAPEYQRDPQAYVQAWQARRGYTEEYRGIEDDVLTILNALVTERENANKPSALPGYAIVIEPHQTLDRMAAAYLQWRETGEGAYEFIRAAENFLATELGHRPSHDELVRHLQAPFETSPFINNIAIRTAGQGTAEIGNEINRALVTLNFIEDPAGRRPKEEKRGSKLKK